MKILLKSATIVDPSGKHHLKQRDILIEKGIIIKIAATIPNDKKIKEVVLKDLHISQGWFDPSVSFGEPGYEERETIDTGLQTAALSGFAHVAVNANTQPITDSKSNIKYLRSKAEGHAVNLYPIGALTVESKGIDLAELYDMQNEGAVSFYDHKKPISNANLLKIALQYTQSFDGLVQSFPFETSVARNGMVNEEINSTRLGLKGIPALSEELQLVRDLHLLAYTGGKLHVPTISTKKSVALVKEAKKKGLNVTCSVALSNLILTDDLLETFDTNYKVLPPLRTKEDSKALLKGLKEGTIDGVTSDHNPIDVEHKKIEFDHAYFGSIGLESCFGGLHKEMNVEAAVSALTNLKSVFKIPSERIEEGNKATLTLFNPNVKWTFTKDDIMSTSANSAFLGETLKGKAYGIFSNDQLILNS
ncbi:dihydroorotase [Cochleicola gelatinilyticus]|uniref:Dihydroorotase n=1 Tax=Cochleicola gelatinilyticus TaxID=1763537 RepID=A0A167H287_9FLAO|nr:dihydroorotase [Cochleicola gelatinilyticus]OAB78137.1 dihydroorotase [Cochleicola gelatinilyticus]